jgi:RND family efflux transporter MFP subunit
MTSFLRVGSSIIALIFLLVTVSPADSAERKKRRGKRDRTAIVIVDPVIHGPVQQTVSVLGRVLPIQKGVVAARVAGPVKRVRLRYGDKVKKGDVIAQIDSATLKWQREMRAAEVAKQKSQIIVATAQLNLARQELKRAESLRSSAAFSQARYEDKRQDVSRYEGSVGEAKAQFTSAMANLGMAELNLKYTEIRAPYHGVILQLHIESGAWLKVGDPVVTLINNKNLEIEADVPFAYLDGLAANSAVKAILQDGKEYNTKVRVIVPDENPISRTRSVRFTPEISDTSKLAQNASATLLIPIGKGRDLTTVAKDALLTRAGERVAFIVKDGKAQMRTVKVGIAVQGRFEVLSGLTPGDNVIVRGNERLSEGQAVRTTGATNSAGANGTEKRKRRGRKDGRKKSKEGAGTATKPGGGGAS